MLSNRMEVKELMVGDLISMNGVVRRVTSVHEKESDKGVDLITTIIPGFTFPDTNLSFLPSHAQPIPLTREILEKNGFTYSQSESNSLCRAFVYTDKFHHEWVEVVLYDMPISGCRCLVKIDTDSRTCNGVNKVHNCDMDYVHQLQHALRLCGIEKEIII